jgi:hypothetical protein
LALVAGVALALSGGAVTATSASAFSVLTSCEIDVGNNTGYAMQMYSQDVKGFKGEDWAKPNEDGFTTYSAGSFEPAWNHCSIDLRFQLQTPDGSGWSQGLETYVYDPNSGHNNAFATATGDFAQRTCVTTSPQDGGEVEKLYVYVDSGPCVPCAIYPCFGTNSATRLRATGDPLSPTRDAARRLPRPKQVPSLLRRGDLTGRGWGRATRPGDFGLLGRVLLAAKVPASCQDKKKESLPSPLREGASAFSRRGGAEFIGAGQGLYANARQSRRTIDDAVSTQSIGCIARLLTSKRFHTTVSTKRLSVTLAGRRLIFNRLKVSTHSGAHIIRTDYIDLTGVQRGKANALLIFASDKRHPDARGVAAATGAVAGRLP